MPIIINYIHCCCQQGCGTCQNLSVIQPISFGKFMKNLKIAELRFLNFLFYDNRGDIYYILLHIFYIHNPDHHWGTICVCV